MGHTHEKTMTIHSVWGLKLVLNLWKFYIKIISIIVLIHDLLITAKMEVK